MQYKIQCSTIVKSILHFQDLLTSFRAQTLPLQFSFGRPFYCKLVGSGLRFYQILPNQQASSGSAPGPPEEDSCRMAVRKRTVEATNVAKTFLSLIDKHFAKDKKLSKIFNRSTLKVSYSCLPNVKQTISNNNHRLLQLHRMKESSQDSKLCNCRQKSSCLTKCVVYKATVTETTSNNQETYIGLTENEFKTRFNLHKSSFKLEHNRTSTTFSDHVWKLKKNYINFNITWRWSKE